MDQGFNLFKTKPWPPVNITDSIQDGKLWFNRTEEVILLRNRNKLIVSFYKIGIVLSADTTPLWDNYFMNFEIKVPRTFSGNIRGFLGNMDGNITNDIHIRGQPNRTFPPYGDRDRELFMPLMTCKLCKYTVITLEHVINFSYPEVFTLDPPRYLLH